MKVYEYRGGRWQWPEGQQPEGAVEVKTKAVEPKNKTVTGRVKRDARTAADGG